MRLRILHITTLTTAIVIIQSLQLTTPHFVTHFVMLHTFMSPVIIQYVDLIFQISLQLQYSELFYHFRLTNKLVSTSFSV